MKGKVTRGTGFLGALRYASDEKPKPGEKKDAVLISSNLDTRQSIKNQASQMRQVALLKPNIKKSVVHFSLSLPPGEGISNEKWGEIARDFLNEMGLDESHQYRVDLHNDKEHQHIHIVSNRISVGGRVWLGKYEALKMIEATQNIEKKHGLTITEGLVFGKKKKNPKSGEIGKFNRTGKVPPKIHIQSVIDTAKKEVKNFSEFVEFLKKQGVVVLPSGKSGSVPGCSFEHAGVAFKGSDLGGVYKWAEIKKATGYDQTRDAELIQKLRSAAPVAPSAPAAVALDPYRGRPGPRKNGGSIECADDDAETDKVRRRKDFQRRMLEKTYQTSINLLLIDMLRYVRIVNGQVEISLEPGGKIIDSGDKISAAAGSRDEIKAMISLAKTKGWKKIQFSGTAAFVERAALASLKNGFSESSVSAKNPVHKAAIDRAILKYSEYKIEQNKRNESSGIGANSAKPRTPGARITQGISPSISPAIAAKRHSEVGQTDLGQREKTLPSFAVAAQADASKRAQELAGLAQNQPRPDDPGQPVSRDPVIRKRPRM